MGALVHTIHHTQGLVNLGDIMDDNVVKIGNGTVEKGDKVCIFVWNDLLHKLK